MQLRSINGHFIERHIDAGQSFEEKFHVQTVFFAWKKILFCCHDNKYVVVREMK